MPRSHGYRKLKVLDMSAEGGAARISVFNKYSPSIAKLWKQKDRVNKCSHKGTQMRLDQEKETAMKELSRTQNLLLSRPVSRASTLWSSQERNVTSRDAHIRSSQERNSRISPKRRPLSDGIKHAHLENVEADDEDVAACFGTLAVRREATFCRSLNQICNATEKERRSWDKQVIRQHQASVLDDKSMELIAPVRRRKTGDRSLRDLKCKSEAIPDRDPADHSLLSSRSLIMTSSVFLTSSQSFQSEVPRYVRLRGGNKHNLQHSRPPKSTSNEHLTPTPPTSNEHLTPTPPAGEPPESTPSRDAHIRTPSPPQYLQPGAYNPEEYRTSSQEDLSEEVSRDAHIRSSQEVYFKHCPSRRLSKTFSSPDIRRLL